jgi:hypothetical protein
MHRLIIRTRVFSRIQRLYSLQPVRETINEPVPRENIITKKKSFFKWTPYVVIGSVGALYLYWRYNVIENDTEYLKNYITSHHAKIIENAVQSGLTSVNNPLNIKKALSAFANSEQYNPSTSKIQVAILDIRPRNSNEQLEPTKQFFQTRVDIIHSLFPDIVLMREVESQGGTSIIRLGSPFTVLQSRQCVVHVYFPITIVNPSEPYDEDKSYPVVAMHIEMSNLNSRVDKFVPQFFITKIEIRDAVQTFPDAPYFAREKRKETRYLPPVVIEEAMSVDGVKQVGDGVLQVHSDFVI